MHQVAFFALLVLAVPCALAQTKVWDLAMRGALKYGINDGTATCDFANVPCAPLSDCWGFSGGGRHYALVGVVNGIDVVDVTSPRNPTRDRRGWIKGCYTEWRDIKARGSIAYGVADYTVLCNCTEPPCQQQIKVNSPPSVAGFIPVSTGKVTPKLNTFPAITGNLVMAIPYLACSQLSNPADVAGNIVVLGRGECNIADKVWAAQKAGAIGVVVVAERDDVVFPSMNGNGTGLTIPAVLCRLTDGAHLLQAMGSGAVSITISSTFNVNNDHYQPPEGLTVIDLSAPSVPQLVLRTRQFFNFAHNILVDTEAGRPYAYICGMDTYHGGLAILSLTNPTNPTLLGVWDTAYLHDITIHKRGDRYLMFGAAIYIAMVYVIDVTDPTHMTTVASFATLDMPHNTAISDTGNMLYLTHEDFKMPVTIYDVGDLTAVRYMGQIAELVNPQTIPHNAFVRDDKLWISYYSEGVVVYDISSPSVPKMLAQRDTSPATGGFHGVWGVYPYREDAAGAQLAYASDIEEGLFVLELQSSDADPTHQAATRGTGRTTVVLLALPLFCVAIVVGLLALAAFIYAKRTSSPQYTFVTATAITDDMADINEDGGL